MERIKCIRLVLPLALVLCMLLSLTACGGYSISIVKDSEAPAEVETEAVAGQDAETTKPESNIEEETIVPEELEEDPQDKICLLWVDVKAYDKSYCHDRPTLEMDGITYMNGFELTGYALFNLEGKYNMLEFDVGHTGTIKYDKEVLVYLDGTLAETIELKAEEMVKHIAIPLNGAKQLKLDTPQYDSAHIGFANAVLS